MAIQYHSLKALKKDGLPVKKQTTEGSVLKDILCDITPEGEPCPIVRDFVDRETGEVRQTQPHYILVFEDGCEFTLTLSAYNYFSAEDFNGEPNPDYLPCGFVPGVKLSAMREPKTRRPLIKQVK